MNLKSRGGVISRVSPQLRMLLRRQLQVDNTSAPISIACSSICLASEVPIASLFLASSH
jgi:hypothetical protein